MGDEEKEVMWIVHWEYSDKSNHGFIKVFDSEAEARTLFDILEKHADGKTWFIDQIDAVRSYD